MNHVAAGLQPALFYAQAPRPYRRETAPSFISHSRMIDLEMYVQFIELKEAKINQSFLHFSFTTLLRLSHIEKPENLKAVILES